LGFTQSPATVDDRLDEKIQRAAIEAAKKKFAPEFMNRIDKVVVFKMLKPEHLEQILEIELGLVQQRILQAIGNSQFVFSCTAKVKQFLMQEGTDAKYGARHLKRAIEKNLVFPLANLVATGQVKLGDFVRIDMNGDNRLLFVKEAEGAMVPVLLEKYSQEAGAVAATARTTRSASRREFTATPLLNQK
jgi:ATP-dependent Clp protease ATP-binding subunit ClpA